MTAARRTIRAWMMYDFANSAFAAIVQATVFPAYYANVGVRKPFFVWLTVVSVVATALLATVDRGMALRGFALGVVGLVTYEAAIVYYNSYLPALAPPGELGRISAGGFAVGYAGSIVAFLAAWPFADAGRYGGCFVAAAVLFGLFSIPAFVALPSDGARTMTLGVALRRGAAETVATLREIMGRPERVQ